MASVYVCSKEEITAIEKARKKNKNKRGETRLKALELRAGEEETAILSLFRECAEKGEVVEVREIKEACQAAVDHPISAGQIYFVLKRHGWCKVMPRSKHP